MYDTDIKEKEFVNFYLRNEYLEDTEKDKILDIEFSVIPFNMTQNGVKSDVDEQSAYIQKQKEELDFQIADKEKEIDVLNAEIDRLTNHADGLDYTIAVASGILCGLIDSFFVGEWDFKNAKAISNKKANEKVMAFAKKHGFDETKCKSSDKLGSAIEFLEGKYKLPGDGAYATTKQEIIRKANEAGLNLSKNEKQKFEKAIKFLEGKGINVEEKIKNLKSINEYTHHLDDFCHHPNIIGLMCCVLVQFTGSTIYVNSSSDVINLPIAVNEYGKFVGKNPITKLFSGVINWLFNVAKTVSNTKGHWMSDLVGSHGSVDNGMGLPGPIMSTLKELSALPCFKDKDFGENLRKAFQNGIGTGKKQANLGIFNNLFEGASSKFDSRTEGAIKHELGRQSIPVIINEVLVRGFYFARRFITEMRNVDSIRDIPWKSVLPFKNRTIVRMMTIASGTFCAVDLGDAAIRSVIKSGGNAAAFGASFILHVNFVGIGRFAIAVGVDIGMGIERQRRINERIQKMNEIISLETAKVYYKQADMWIAAEDAGKAIIEAYRTAEEATRFYAESFNRIEDDLYEIRKANDKTEQLFKEINEKFLEIENGVKDE